MNEKQMENSIPLSSRWEPHKQFVGDGDHLLDENLLIVSLPKWTWEQGTQSVSTCTSACHLTSGWSKSTTKYCEETFWIRKLHSICIFYKTICPMHGLFDQVNILIMSEVSSTCQSQTCPSFGRWVSDNLLLTLECTYPSLILIINRLLLTVSPISFPEP